MFALLFFPFPGEASGGPGRCKVDPRYRSEARGNASCLVVYEGKLLVGRHKKTGKLDLPGGTAEQDETAQCTAHRETWEETSVHVEVGRLLEKFPNDFYLFECRPVSKQINPVVSEKFRDDVSEALLLDPLSTKNDDWRFPYQTPTIKWLFQKPYNLSQ